MNEYFKLKELILSSELTKSKDKLLKNFQFIQSTIEEAEIKKIISYHSKSESQGECTWDSLNQFIINSSSWFFQIAIKDKNVSELPCTPLNKKVIELFPNLLRNVFFSAMKDGCSMDINLILNFIAEMFTNYFTSLFDMCMNLLKTFPRNFPLLSIEILVKVSLVTWESFDNSISKSLLQLTIFEETHVHLLMAMLETYNLRKDFICPDLSNVVLYLEHISNLSGFNSSIKACGFVAAIYNHLVLIHNCNATTCLTNLGLSLSAKGLTKIWVKYKHQRLTRSDTNCSLLSIYPRMEIMDMFLNVLILSLEVKDSSLEPSISLWITSITSALEDEVEYSENKESISDDRMWIHDKKFFKLIVTLIFQEKFNITEEQFKKLKKDKLLTNILEGISSKENVVQLFWLNILEAGLNNESFNKLLYPFHQQIINVINECLDKSYVHKDVATCALLVAEMLVFEGDHYDVSSLAQTIFGRYFSSHSIASCRYLERTLTKELSFMSPCQFLPKLFLHPLTTLTTNLAAQVILVPSKLSVRKLVPSQCRHEFLRQYLNDTDGTEMLFSKSCSLISALIVGKSCASHCYKPVYGAEDVDHCEDSLFSLEDLVHFLNLHLIPIKKTRQRTEVLIWNNFTELSNPSKILLNTLLTYSSKYKQSFISWIQLFFMAEVFKYGSSSIYNNELVYVINKAREYFTSNAVSYNIVDGIGLISWETFYNIVKNSEDLLIKETLLSFIMTIEEYIHTKLYKLGSNEDDREFTKYISCYLSFMSKIMACDKVSKVLGSVITDLDISKKQSIARILCIIEGLLSFKVKMTESFYSKLLTIIKDSFKIHKNNPKTCKVLINVITLIVIVVDHENITEDAKKKVIKFLYDLSCLVFRVVGNNFREETEIKYEFFVQKGVILAYYWKEDNKKICAEIFNSVFEQFLRIAPFSQRLFGHFFFASIKEHLPSSQLSSVTQEFMSVFPIDNFRHLIIDSDNEDIRRSLIASFIQMMFSCQIISNQSEVLSFLDESLPNSIMKCDFISQLLKSLFLKDGLKEVFPQFLYSLINIQCECRFIISLPGNYNLKEMILENCAEILWNVFSNDSDKVKCILNYISTITEVSDVTDLVTTHIPYLVARSIISHTLEDKDMSLYSYVEKNVVLKVVKESIEEVYVCIIENISLYTKDNKLVEDFRHVCTSFHNLYLHSQGSFEDWLIEKQGRLITLLMMVVSKFNRECLKKCSTIWCTMMEVFISSQLYWDINVNNSQIDATLSFLILRHLNLMNDSLTLGISSQEIDILYKLVILSHGVVINFNNDIHLVWHHQIFHFFSSCWKRLAIHNDTISNIFNLLIDQSKWTESLHYLDQYMLSTCGFSNVPAISTLLMEPSLVKSLTDFLYFYQKFNIVYFQYHSNYFVKLFSVLHTFSTLDCEDDETRVLLQTFNHVLNKIVSQHIFATSQYNNNKIRSSILLILAHLTVILPPLLFFEECQIINGNTLNNPLMEYFMYCINDFGSKAWFSYDYLSSVEVKEEKSYLSNILVIFVKEEHIRRSKDSGLVSVLNNSILDYSFSRILRDDIRNIFTMDIFDVSIVIKFILPYFKNMPISKINSKERESKILCVNEALKGSQFFLDPSCKIVIQWVLSLFYCDMGKVIMDHFDLKSAAQTALKAGMYTATLVFLERMLIENNEVFFEDDIVEMFRNCYKHLGCQEELSAGRFITSKESESDSYKWLFYNGKFDILKQLVQDQPSEEALSDNINKVKVLWKLSRWDDYERYEVFHLNDKNCSNLLMYDALYQKSRRITDEYKQHVSSLCQLKWDTEECLKPLVILNTLNYSADCRETSLVSLIKMAKKSNIRKVNSSLTFDVVSLGRYCNGGEVIARHSMSICDLAVSCSRLDYIDLILDMFKSEDVVTCAGKSACFRMAAIIKFWNEGNKRRCNPELEKLIGDCKDHLTLCKSPSSEHSLLIKLYGQAIAKLCEWNRIYPVRSANYIRKNFLDTNSDLITSNQVKNTHLLEAMTTFSYQQYNHINTYMHSLEYENRRNLVTENRRNLRFLEGAEYNKEYKHTLMKQTTHEENDLSSLSEERDLFLLSAFMNCIKCLEESNDHDFKIFSLITMWFNNSEIEHLSSIMSEVNDKVPSYKFLVSLPQLCARLNSDSNSKFQKTLTQLIEKIVMDHPYHSLYNIFVLRNANKDVEINKVDISKRQRSDDKMNGRITAASNMIERLLKGHRMKVVKDVEILTEAYIQLANMSVGNTVSKVQKNIQLPRHCNLVKLGSYIDLPNPLIFLPVDFSCKYSANKLVKIVSFNSVYSLVGGINSPKVITCIGSDGVHRQQLVKGKDDLRQDSVMQQVFSVVNVLMRNSNLSDSYGLSIRTYKVIPTSKLSGIIEWCEGTVPLGDWLTKDKTGGHVRYRPNDLPPDHCKRKLVEVMRQPVEKRVRVFNEIYEEIKPVFGYFLFENFPDPRQWFKARKTYIQSVANSSMVGFILGLGDRHVQNILMDLKTAEVIHIDFGIAFDQGRLLGTPELVPFRLTRDLVHAMGPFGVEGRFKVTCCNMLNMLRSQQDIITTLIEVLVYDPLHAWSLSSMQANALQKKRLSAMENTEILLNISNSKLFSDTDKNTKTNSTQNQIAERIILELSRKLSGNVENCCLNVEGHVNYLIQAASDVDNLARMFVGWQAYL